MVSDFAEDPLSSPEETHEFDRSETKTGGEHPSPPVDFLESSVSFSLERVGHFRIIKKIAAGGMGIVYEAEQDRPRRRVALKLLRPFSSASAGRRFEAEADILARLDHPGIARVFEAGTVECMGNPQSFMAMELVEGTTLETYVGKLESRSALQIIADLCDSVHHAHQAGVIHRDIKPTNILITEDLAPKVIDFGVAHLESKIESTLTRRGDILGTLPYMSPEQVAGAGDRVDTRTDVYSLGVVCFELLSGRRPFESDSDDLPRWMELISSGPIPALGSVQQRWRGDLETVVTKAMAKAPGDRYSSAAEFAADIRRYLDGLPTEARPPTSFERTMKFARRHRLAVGTVAFLVVAFLTLGALLLRQAMIAAREAESSRELLSVYTRTFSEARNLEMVGGSLDYHDLLQTVEDEMNRSFANRPVLRSAIEDTLGVAHAQSGNYPKSDELLQRALATRRRDLGDDHPSTLVTRSHLGYLRLAEGRFEAARSLLRRVAEDQQDRIGKEHPQTLVTRNWLGVSCLFDGAIDAADVILTDVHAARRRVLGADDPRTAGTAANLALVMRRQGRLEQAEAMYRSALLQLENAYGDGHSEVLAVAHDLGRLLQETGRFDDSAALLHRHLASGRRRLRAGHPDLSVLTGALAEAELQRGRFDVARTLYDEAIRAFESAVGKDHPRVLVFRNGAAFLEMRRRQYAKAAEEFTDVRAGLASSFGPTHEETLLASMNLATALERSGQLARARQVLEESLVAARKGRHLALDITLEDRLRFLETDSGVGQQLFMARGKALEVAERATRATSGSAKATEEGLTTPAIKMGSIGYEMARKGLGPKSPITLIAMTNLAEAYRMAGHLDEAQRLYDTAWTPAIREEAPASIRANILFNRGNLHRDRKKPLEAEKCYRSALESFAAAEPEARIEVAAAKVKASLGLLLLEHGRSSEGESLVAEVLENLESRDASDGLESLIIRGNLGELLLERDARRAERVLREVSTTAIELLPPESRYRFVFGENHALALGGCGRIDEARHALARLRKAAIDQFGASDPEVAYIDACLQRVEETAKQIPAVPRTHVAIERLLERRPSPRKKN